MSNNTKDTIFIGKKPLMTYVTSVIIQLATLPLITIKARGLSIAHAVDVAQIVLHRTNPAFMIGDVKIDSELLESQDGRTRNVSTIEISIKKKIV
ncbi:DNA-binding protein [Nitrosopumilus sp.]|uniref:DNA-binding protein n=1 Tax=Nitrosopumilus sp. TaxID=2024843 RepID=UPI00292F28E1|nr:DNA-binding protein [Nitrosopumilus sp.]